MRMVPALVTLVMIVAGSVWSAAPVEAQPLGSFRWQLQPYCNVVTFAVVQQGGQYQLDGTDDQCGAAVKASAVGLAFQNPNGSIGFGFTAVTAPGGTAVNVDATISIVTLSGTWRDSAGNSGTFIFTPGAGVPGAPRPVPLSGLAPASVTNIQIANNAVNSSNVIDASITTADLASPPQLQFLPTLSSGGTLTASATTIRTIALTAPSPGRVMVTVSGNFQIASTVANDVAQCSLTTQTGIDFSGRVEGRTNYVGTTYVPFSITRVFVVAAAGTFTANFNCLELGTGNIIPYEIQTTALFVP